MQSKSKSALNIWWWEYACWKTSIQHQQKVSHTVPSCHAMMTLAFFSARYKKLQIARPFDGRKLAARKLIKESCQRRCAKINKTRAAEFASSGADTLRWTEIIAPHPGWRPTPLCSGLIWSLGVLRLHSLLEISAAGVSRGASARQPPRRKFPKQFRQSFERVAVAGTRE